MGIRNEMEQLVREEVARIKEKEKDGSGRTGCRCPLCETDIVALALTLLPPLYCRAGGIGHSAVSIRAGTITDAVQAAFKRVDLCPKHRPGALPARRDDIDLINYTFEVGSQMVGPALGRSVTGCSCEECRFDTLAYALNRYPSKYGITRGGRRNLHPTYVDFMRYELGMLINQAARVVSTRPHHGAC